MDGSGSPPFAADVGIRAGRVVEIAPRVAAAREIDASGCLVAPGLIDIHTHYDPQVLWDPWLSPSCWHGVTTVVAGNCGYSIAPARPETRGMLLRTLDKVEDIHLSTLEAGVDWDYPAWRKRTSAELAAGFVNWDAFLVSETDVRPELIGRSAASIARERGVSAFEAACELALEDWDARFVVTSPTTIGAASPGC